jgi:hypothetical protein
MAVGTPTQSRILCSSKAATGSASGFLRRSVHVQPRSAASDRSAIRLGANDHAHRMRSAPLAVAAVTV